MTRFTMTTQRQVRDAFWETCASMPGVSRRRGLTYGDYNADTRAAFADFVDMLSRNGTISEALAFRVTLT